mgnify:CR=1 FL=1|tara:strand:+ start:1259 stop:1504 length:246 start_codon:yes stop_codon:yes gene_type:complete
MTAPTTTVISDSLTNVEQALYHLLNYECDELTIAIQILRTLGTLTDEYPMEYFTDEEIDLITEATVESIHYVKTLAEQGEL